MLNTVRGRHADQAGICIALAVVHGIQTCDPKVAILIALASIPCEIVPLQKVTTESEKQRKRLCLQLIEDHSLKMKSDACLC